MKLVIVGSPIRKRGKKQNKKEAGKERKTEKTPADPTH